MVSLGLLIATGIPLAAQALELRIAAATVHYEGYTVTGLSVQLHDGGAVLGVQSVITPDDMGLVLRDLTVRCERLDFAGGDICAAGPWSFVLADAAGGWQLPFSGILDGLTQLNDAWTLQSSVVSGKFLARISARGAADKIEGTFVWNGQQIGNLPALPLVAQQIEWVNAGLSSGQLKLHWPTNGSALVDYAMSVEGLGFDSPAGRFAGEDLGLKAAGVIQLDATAQAQVNGNIHSGALLIDNFYTTFSDSSLEWGGRVSKKGSSLSLGNLSVSDGRSLELKAEAELDLDNPLASLRYRVSRFAMHFPEAYERYIESIASAWTLDGLTVTGSLLWSGQGQAGAPASGVFDVADLSIVDDKRGRFAVTGLAAHILPGDQGVDSRFSWRGLLLQRINLGPGEAAVNADGRQFSLASPLRLNVLGGHFALEELHVRLPGNAAAAATEPEIRLVATLEDMDMEQLTKALDWPSFTGSVSGKIPGVTLDKGVLAVEGQIEFKVFAGQILLSGLRIERPFGVLPSLAADLEARDLDLQQLTHTFSFGGISGRMSGFVHELRMLDWQPVAFDAWFGTPEQASGSHNISRQAVNHLTTIGGGSATTALSGPLLKFFNDFSYKRLGLGCRLHNNICAVRGLDDNASSVLIMEGAGVPKIMIRAFNRQMDFPTLVAGLTAAAQGDSIKIGDQP